jgi:TRAP transporter TAXI family solute receptor
MGRTIVKRLSWTIIAIAAVLAAALPLGAQEQRFHFFASLGTGPMDGVYYPVGGAICATVNEDLRSSGVRCSRETTPGSVYNIDALRSGELEFGLVQSDVAYAAYTGEGAFLGAPFKDLRSVLALHTELVTIVARPEIHQLADLSGKRINVGPEGSGSRLTWDGIQGALGWTPAQAPKIVDMPIDAIGRALCTGSIHAVLLVLGHPSGRIAAMLGGCALTLLPVEGPAIDAFVAARPYFTKERIAGAHYGLSADVPTFGVTAILMTTANMDSRVVAEFAKSLTTQIDTLKQKHPVLENLTEQAMAPQQLPAPLHPAAAQAYTELGLRQ